VSAEEILDVVDQDERVVGQLPRADVYARRLTHRCAVVLVRNAAGEVFVHRRADDKLAFPAAYDMFVGGVVGAGESYDEAAAREAAEELGVSTLDTPRFVFRFRYDDPVCGSWWMAVYEMRHDGPVHPQESEIAWYDWVAPAELDRMRAELPWTPDCAEAYERWLARPGPREPGPDRAG
jgi:isopentenyldiphosphate isomerase